MDKANVKIIHYVKWDDNKIREAPAEWDKLKAYAAKLGITLINIAK
jgi:hypothetical protein